MDRGAFEPLTVYLAGDEVDDFEDSVGGVRHTEPGGRFRARADIRSGYLNPRYVVIDAPGMWERVSP